MEEFRSPGELRLLNKRRVSLLKLNFLILFILVFSLFSFMIDFYTVESLVIFGISFVIFLIIRYQLYKNKLEIHSPATLTEPGEFKPNRDDMKYVRGGGR